MKIFEILKPKSTEELKDLENRGFRINMGKWKFVISIKDEMNSVKNTKDLDKFRHNMAKILTKKLNDIKLLNGKNGTSDLRKIIKDFKSKEIQPTKESIDNILEKMYDWANDNNVWIDSF